MGRHSSNTMPKMRKGLWSPEEDEKLRNYINVFGLGCWSSVPKLAGLQRCGKSCRLRWINYLRPDLKRGLFSKEEEFLIISLHRLLGNRWAQIATKLPGRTDNEIKNFWNSSLKRKLMMQGIDPQTHKPLDFNNNVIKNSSKDHIFPQETIKPVKLEQQSYVPYIPTDNSMTSVFSNTLSSPSNSNFSFFDPSTDACHNDQSLIPSECNRHQMNVFKPATELQSQQYTHSSMSVQMPNILEDNADCFSESLTFTEARDCSSSGSNNNISTNASFSWENEEKKLESGVFQYPFDNYELIRMEASSDQPSSWQEEQFTLFSMSRDLTASDSGNYDTFLQHFRL